jgi:hypothetical protein
MAALALSAVDRSSLAAASRSASSLLNTALGGGGPGACQSWAKGKSLAKHRIKLIPDSTSHSKNRNFKLLLTD